MARWLSDHTPSRVVVCLGVFGSLVRIVELCFRVIPGLMTVNAMVMRSQVEARWTGRRKTLIDPRIHICTPNHWSINIGNPRVVKIPVQMRYGNTYGHISSR